MTGRGSRRLIVLGAGGHAAAVADLAAECGWHVVGFTDVAGSVKRPGVLGEDEEALSLYRAGRLDAAVVGVGNSNLGRRAELFALLKASAVPTPSLVHPRGVVSRSCRVGEGAVVLAAGVLGAQVELGDNVVVYSGAIVEHGCHVGDHAYLSPGVVLSGDVRVEAGAFLGAGAVVLPGLTIGKDAVVGAGGVVTGGVAAGQVVAGVPARPLRERGTP